MAGYLSQPQIRRGFLGRVVSSHQPERKVVVDFLRSDQRFALATAAQAAWRRLLAAFNRPARGR